LSQLFPDPFKDLGFIKEFDLFLGPDSSKVLGTYELLTAHRDVKSRDFMDLYEDPKGFKTLDKLRVGGKL
jgi:hypothetical protein